MKILKTKTMINSMTTTMKTMMKRRIKRAINTAMAPLVLAGSVLLLTLVGVAQEMGPVTAPGAPKQPGAFEMLLPFVFVFAIFYFLVIRPQVKRQKNHQKFISELKRGDEVITSSGILGTIEGLTDRFVTLEVADGVSIRVLRSQVASTLAQQQQEVRK